MSRPFRNLDYIKSPVWGVSGRDCGQNCCRTRFWFLRGGMIKFQKSAAFLAFGLGLTGLLATSFSHAQTVTDGVAAGQVTGVEARPTETASLYPGIPEPSWGPERTENARTALPQPLSEADADLYRQIFEIQKDGDWKASAKLIEQLDNRMLMGHVTYQRLMHPTKYRSKYTELKNWMDQYADHPDATRVYKLALKRRPANYKYPAKVRPAVPSELVYSDTGRAATKKPKAKINRSSAQRAQIRKHQRQIKRWVQRGSVTKSLDYLHSKSLKRLFDPVSYSQSMGVIARGYFRYHKDQEAIEMARKAVAAHPEGASNAAWWGGLAAFRMGNLETAASLFSALADMPYAEDGDRAAGAFWASRSYLIGGQPAKVNPMLQKAAVAQRSFYGLLAIGALGQTPGFDWDLRPLSEDQTDILRRIPAATRAMALIQSGNTTAAEAELKRLVEALPLELAEILLAMADQAGLADLAYRVGASLERRFDLTLDAALYPTPGFEPRGGFTIDRALIFALIRQESRFRPTAKSRAGARGLMQVMPATAGFVEKKRFRGRGRDALLDPSYNMHVGQKYVQMLMDDKTVGQNLFYTLAAYNGGPGNLSKWRKKVDYKGDPLLFIESIPSRETRNYVEHVLSNLWVYRHRMQQRAPTLHALLAGNWPVYISLDQH